MRGFYLAYGHNEKLQRIVGEIGWGHNISIMEKCKDELQREFYARMTRKFGWTRNILIHQIDNQTYEKTLLNQVNFDKTLPKKLRNQAKLAVRDEYTFDILLYHRVLRSYVAVELKTGKFMPEYIGKMQFYLAALDDLVRMQHDNPSIGIILCRSKNRTVVEYALRDSSKLIGVAAYRMVSSLPEELSGQLPAPEQVALLMAEA